MADSRHRANTMHSSNISNPASTNTPNEGAVAAAAAAVVAASASSSSAVGHVSSNETEGVMIPLSASDLDVLRASLANSGLGAMVSNSSNINLNLSGGNIIVNATSPMNQLTIDQSNLAGLGQRNLRVVAPNAHVVHSNEITSNGIVEQHGVGSSSGNNDINNSIGRSGVNSLGGGARNSVLSQQQAIASVGSILTSVSVDNAGNITSSNFLPQMAVMNQGAILGDSDIAFANAHVPLGDNCSRNDNNAAIAVNTQHLATVGDQQVVNSHQQIIGGSSNIITTTATANIHHRAHGSNSAMVGGVSSGRLTTTTLSSTIGSSNHLGASNISAGSSTEQAVWVPPDQSRYVRTEPSNLAVAIASTSRGDALALSRPETSTITLQQPSSSHGVVTLSGQSLSELQHVVQIGGQFQPEIQGQYSGVFQVPVQHSGQPETFQAAAHSTFGLASSPASDYREIGTDREATPAYASIQQHISAENVTSQLNAAPAVDSSTLPSGYNFVFHAGTREFSMQRVISPSDCTVSQSTLSLEGSEAPSDQQLMPMTSQPSGAYAMVQVSSMPSFSTGGASEVSTSSMAAVLGVEDRASCSRVGSLENDLSSSQGVVVLGKIENSNLVVATECDTTQEDLDFHRPRTPAYIGTSNNIDDDPSLDSTVARPVSVGAAAAIIMDSTLDSSNITPLQPLSMEPPREAIHHSDIGPSTSGITAEERRANDNDAVPGPSGIYSNLMESRSDNMPESSGISLYVRKSRRLELQEQVPSASQRKMECSYRQQIYNPNMLWCDDCMKAYETECSVHRPTVVQDKVVLSRAWASCPNQIQIFRVAENMLQPGDSSIGVYVKRQIPKMTQFGPLVADMVDSSEQISNSCFPLMLEMEDGTKKYFDTQDENKCNWMMFVRPAKTFAEQNLVAYQYKDGIYFSVTKLIDTKQEIKVWYAAHYAERLGFQPLDLTEEDMQALDEEEARFPCCECNRRFKSSAALQKHSEMAHENEDLFELDNLRSDEDEDFSADAGGNFANGNGDGDRKKSQGKGRQMQGRGKGRNGDASNYQWKKKSTSIYLNKTLKKYKKRQCSDKTLHSMRTMYRKQGKDTGGNEWVCTHCGLTFDKRSLLNLHTLTHAAENLAGDIKMEQISGADIHQLNIPVDDGMSVLQNQLSCPKCSVVFNDSRELMNHVATHAQRQVKREKPFDCNSCSKSFSTEEKLLKHRMVHGDDAAKPLECNVCHKRLINNSAMACHMKTHSAKKYYDCPVCGDDFDMVSSLKDHSAKHLDAHGNYPCPQCVKVFGEFSMLKKHIRSFHSSRVFECMQCGKEFSRVDKLKLHMLKHTSHREFMCETCGRQFKRKDKLKEHMTRMHSKERLEQKKERQQSKELKKFIPKVMPTEYQRFIYKCHTCLLGFKRRGMLVNHLAKRHPEVKPEQVPELNLPILKTQKDFYCQYCDKIYKSSSKRKAHILKNHPGSQVPPSARKKMTSVDSAVVMNNNFSHTIGSITTMPHGCKFCHKQYASKAKLVQHQRKKHAELVEPTQGKRRSKPIRSDFLQISVDTSQAIPERYEAVPITVVSQADTLPNTDLLTQAMSELHSYGNEFTINPRLTSNNASTMQVHIQPSQLAQTIDLNQLNQALQTLTSQGGVTTVLAPPQGTPIQQVNSPTQGVSVVAQNGQQISLSGGHLITRPWPAGFTTHFS